MTQCKYELHQLVQRNPNLSEVVSLLESGLFINQIITLDAIGFTPLHYASRMGRSDILEELLLNLDRDVDIDILSSAGTKPIHEAALNGHIDSIDTLRIYNQDLKSNDFFGRNIRDIGIEIANVELVEFAKTYRCGRNVSNQYQEMKLLKNHTADVDSGCNKKGRVLDWLADQSKHHAAMEDAQVIDYPQAEYHAQLMAQQNQAAQQASFDGQLAEFFHQNNFSPLKYNSDPTQQGIFTGDIATILLGVIASEMM